MYELADNLYNQTVSPDKPKLKLWTSAGILLTYKCPAACDFCYYRCNPTKGGLLAVEDALAAWKSLIKLAGQSAKVHLTGGEPFLYWTHLAELLEKAQRFGLGAVDTIETNAFWADSKNVVTEKLRYLDSHNVNKLKISYDPFHAEFVEYKKVRLLADMAAEILGGNRVMVRWQDYMEKDMDVMNMTEDQKIALFTESIKRHPCRFNGHAAGRLAEIFSDKDITQISNKNCSGSFLSSKGVHIDPHGNVFCGTCSGIIIGNIRKMPLEEIWRTFNPSKLDVLDVLFREGPAGTLLEKAVNHGYKKRRLYSGKCHLCTDLRQFFFDKGINGSIIGPQECYN